MKPTLITGYVNPDLDGVAGAVAYCEYLQKMGEDVEVGIIGEMHPEAKFIFDEFNLTFPQSIQNADDFDQVILVDASDLIGLEGKVAPEKVVEIIDHRKIHEAEKFPNAKVQIEYVGSAATLIAEKFVQNRVEISKGSATLLYGAIISNTLNFQGGVTTDRDRSAAKYLNKIAQLPDNFWKELFLAKSDLSGENLRKRIEGDFAWFLMGEKKVGIAQLEIIGADELVAERGEEIVKILAEIKKELALDYIFQNTIELDKAKNLFITADLSAQKLLEKVLGVDFDGFVAERKNLIMRKQIVPLIKEELEKFIY